MYWSELLTLPGSLIFKSSYLGALRRAETSSPWLKLTASGGRRPCRQSGSRE